VVDRAGNTKESFLSTRVRFPARTTRFEEVSLFCNRAPGARSEALQLSYWGVVVDRIRGSGLEGSSLLAIFERDRKGSSPWSWARAFKKC
jgi:hypothetical protein